MERVTGVEPVPSVWKTDVLAVTPMTQKWWLHPVSRRTLLVFSEALISLSYTAQWSLHEVTLLGLSVIDRWLCF